MAATQVSGIDIHLGVKDKAAVRECLKEMGWEGDLVLTDLRLHAGNDGSFNGPSVHRASMKHFSVPDSASL